MFKQSHRNDQKRETHLTIKLIKENFKVELKIHLVLLEYVSHWVDKNLENIRGITLIT